MLVLSPYHVVLARKAVAGDAGSQVAYGEPCALRCDVSLRDQRQARRDQSETSMFVETLVFFHPTHTPLGVMPSYYWLTRNDEALRHALSAGGEIVDSDADWRAHDRQVQGALDTTL